MDDYSFEIQPLTEDEGGGFLITFPYLPACMSDGETIAAAIANGRDALKCWMATHTEGNRPIPAPGESQSGNFAQPLPKSLPARLVARAKPEGVSLNTMVVPSSPKVWGNARP